MRLHRFILAAGAALILQPAAAGAQDSRVQQIPYAADQVVNLPVSQGFAAVVEFAPDEAIQNVVVGNSSVWQVTANSAANRIIVKPLADAATTNMIVVTDVRRYVFLLSPGGGQDLFVLRFSYPQEATTAAAAAKPAATYRMTGARSLFPSAIRDDGSRTTITWAEQTELPAVFAIGDGGTEAIVNGRMVGRDYVIEGTAPKFIFRRGDAEAVASRRIVKAPR
jgi:type IV secretion system protein VirB9